MFIIIFVCVVFICVVCGCWIMSYLFFKAKANSASEMAKNNNVSQWNDIINNKSKSKNKSKINRAQFMLGSITTSVEMSEMNRGNSNPNSDFGVSTNDINGGEDSHSVSALFGDHDDNDDDVQTSTHTTNQLQHDDDIDFQLVKDEEKRGHLVDEDIIINDTDNDSDATEGDRQVTGHDQGSQGRYKQRSAADVLSMIKYVKDDGIVIVGDVARVTNAGGTKGCLQSGLDESRYQQWSKKDVLIWLKENLMNNGLNEKETKSFLKEFSKHRITGGTLFAIKNRDKNGQMINQIKREFSHENQALGIWIVIQTCIDNIDK